MNARLSPVANSRITVTREHVSDKSEMLVKLQQLLESSFTLRQSGASMREQASAQGYVDGYIESLLDSGHVDQAEVLEIVQVARRGALGPLTSSPLVSGYDDHSSAIMVA